jgi:MFS family permease
MVVTAWTRCRVLECHRFHRSEASGVLAMAVDADAANDTAARPAQAFHPSAAYRHYAVWLLFAVYTCNFVDRQILSIVIEPIKREFGLHDWQLGLLSGLAFAVLYSTLGVPIARLADRRNRVTIIGASIVIWSAFTAATGLSRNFWDLLIARIGVGIGEAGCSPPAYSIISDYVEHGKRATALSIYSMGASMPAAHSASWSAGRWRTLTDGASLSSRSACRDSRSRCCSS